ncbi:MAG: hypothetical protein E7518_08850 [Ruminococcaceae bacterium]|nr:hypothetical protein [Oscillospiraceae bacterium]
MKGIDVSRHNGTVNWGMVDASGIDFVLVRAGYGNDISQKDQKFDENVKGALAHKLFVGAYWFSYAISVEDAKKEAEVCKKVLSAYRGKLTFPVAFDYEYASMEYAKKKGIPPTNQLIDAIARAFLDSMKQDGWFVCLYTNQDFIRSGKFTSETIQKYDLWLADYSGPPDYPCGIQQTGNTGSVPGIAGNVDLDISYRDYPTIIKSGGYNGFPKMPSTAVAIDTTMDISLAHGQYYVVKTTANQTVTLTAGTSGVVTVVRFPRTGNDQLFALVAIGTSGQATGIYTAAGEESPLKRFVVKIK